MNTRRTTAAVIGAGAAGLMVARHLQEAGIESIVLEEHDRVGDSWRERYDSLRLFSPRWASSLPGYPAPVAARACPSRNAMGDYLEEYAERFALPVQVGVKVEGLRRHGGGGFELDLDGRDGPDQIVCDLVVVAAGAHRRPVRPPFASQIDPSARQLHSLDYRRPSDLAPGTVLVVGAGNSGTDIALEAAAAGHPTVLAGRHPGQMPIRIDTVRGFLVGGVILFLLRHLTIRTPMGRAAERRQRGHGLPLIRNRLADLDDAHVQRIGRVVGVREGLPVTAEGRTVTASTIIWCTGSRPDLSWIDVDGALDEEAEPRQTSGLADAVPGLGYVGLDFQYSAASSTIQGMDRDARSVLRGLRRALPRDTAARRG